ncbi:MAG: hypothetical protein KKA19_01555, partial [Candidatus Margulisbacteria bacterium]|nr:hypothetical protein [Candidatus Margulisiibacteriota bacterium]
EDEIRKIVKDLNINKDSALVSQNKKIAKKTNSVLKDTGDDSLENENNRDNEKKEILNEKGVVQEQNETKSLFKMPNMLPGYSYDFRVDDEDVIFLGFFGVVNSLDEFKHKILNMSSENLTKLLRIIFNKNILNFKFEDKAEFELLFLNKQEYYVTYEHLAFILLHLVKNIDNLSLKQSVVSSRETFSMNFPIKIVDAFADAITNKFNISFWHQTGDVINRQTFIAFGERAVIKTNLVQLSSEFKNFAIRNKILQGSDENIFLTKEEIKNKKLFPIPVNFSAIAKQN